VGLASRTVEAWWIRARCMFHPVQMRNRGKVTGNLREKTADRRRRATDHADSTAGNNKGASRKSRERRLAVRSGGSEVAPAFGLRVLAAPLFLRRGVMGLATRQPVPRNQSAGETGRTPNAGASHEPLAQQAPRTLTCSPRIA